MELSQGALFEVPRWMAAFDEVVPFHDEMTQELLDLIDTAPHDVSTRFLAQQTPCDPFLLPSPGWRLLEQLSNECYSKIAKRHFQRWRTGEFHLRRWAIKFGTLSKDDKKRMRRDGIHNHLPALFSSIYYLRVPPEFDDHDAGGTLFVNPIGNLMDLMSPRSAIIAPKEGRFVIFPAFVDHTPIPCEWDASGVPRIVVSTDIFYVSGESMGSTGSNVLRANV